MATAGVVEAVYILEDGSFRLPPGWPRLPPDHFRFQGFEERLDGGVVVALAPRRSLMDAGHPPRGRIPIYGRRAVVNVLADLRDDAVGMVAGR